MAGVSHRETVKLKRLLNVVTFLTNNHNVKVGAVCETFGLTRRQLMSLLEEILMIGLPPYSPWDYITVTIEGDRIWTANADWLQRPLNLTAEEAVSLKLMIRNFIRQSPGIFEGAGASLEAKVQAFLGYAPDETVPARHATRKIAVMKRALEESRVLEIVYYDRYWDKVTVRQVEPFATADWAGTPCLLAYCRYSHKPTRFGIERIREAKLLGEIFVPRGDLDRMLLERIKTISARPHGGKLTVRFGPKRARWARELFDYAEIVDEADGGVKCVFTVFDHHGLADFIAEFEGEATVDGPDEFRARFHNYLKDIADLYD